VLEDKSRVEYKELEEGGKEEEYASCGFKQQGRKLLKLDKKIVHTTMQKEVNLSNLHPKENKELTKLFHIKIQIKKTKVDTLFYSDS
jgi:hypothetical protein